MHDNERGVIHVRHDAKRLAALRGVLVTGVQVAELVKARGEVRQAGEPLEQAGAHVALVVSGRGRAGRDGHSGLVKFLVENVAHE